MAGPLIDELREVCRERAVRTPLAVTPAELSSVLLFTAWMMNLCPTGCPVAL